MPGRDRKLDPVTGDYVADANGGYATTTTIATAVQHQLNTRRGEWWGDPDAGSDLHLVKQRGAGAQGVIFARNAIRTALQPFVDDGRARGIVVDGEGEAGGRVCLDVAITDIQGGVLPLSQLVEFE